MRDIKFRLYNEEDNRMEQVTSITSFGPEGLICDSEFEGEESGWLGTQPVMQFTGLTDCDGVEVFEGDVVKISSRGFMFTVHIKSLCAKNGLDIDFIGQCEDHMFYSPLWDECEVIGNIHQNPELLENNQ